MFCPSCGLEDKQANQFCRACGSDLRNVRAALSKPDAVTDSAVTARDEISRAFAARIRQAQTAVDMKIVAEDVLPRIERFLASPEEKRLRRMRSGTILASIGAGVAVSFTIAALLADEDFLFFACLGFVAFCIGLSFLANALLFSIPKKTLSDKFADAEDQRRLDGAAHAGRLGAPVWAESQAESARLVSSVTENTTRHLSDKELTPRR